MILQSRTSRAGGGAESPRGNGASEGYCIVAYRVVEPQVKCQSPSLRLASDSLLAARKKADLVSDDYVARARTNLKPDVHALIFTTQLGRKREREGCARVSRYQRKKRACPKPAIPTNQSTGKRPAKVFVKAPVGPVLRCVGGDACHDASPLSACLMSLPAGRSTTAAEGKQTVSEQLGWDDQSSALIFAVIERAGRREASTSHEHIRPRSIPRVRSSVNRHR